MRLANLLDVGMQLRKLVGPEPHRAASHVGDHADVHHGEITDDHRRPRQHRRRGNKEDEPQTRRHDRVQQEQRPLGGPAFDANRLGLGNQVGDHPRAGEQQPYPQSRGATAPAPNETETGRSRSSPVQCE